jgi:hypothetical protein
VGGALFAASSANAAAIFLQTAQLNKPASAYITGPITGVGTTFNSLHVYNGPVTFTANYGTAADATPANTFSFLGFCIDIYHEINTNIANAAPLAVNLQYQTQTLTHNGYGVGLSNAQKQQISALVNFATTIAFNDADYSNKMGGVQGAIWQIENPNYDVVGGPDVGYGSSASGVNAYMAQYTLAAVTHAIPVGKIITVYDYTNPLTGGHQAFAFAGGVPEPATWLMMILGFGGIGAMLRRRRQGVAVATA